MHLVLLSLLAALTALMLVVALLAVFQERVVWQPPAHRGPADEVTAAGRRVAYVAADGQRLHGYVVAGATDRVLVAFHGNAETAAQRTGWATTVAGTTGWTVFVPEYRGYAGATGTPSYAGSQADARAAYAFARDSLGAAPERIAIHGFSLGTAVATELASEVRPTVLILDAPFTSARAMARATRLPPFAWLWRWIARVHFDTRARVTALDVPVWVAHGGRDRVIPTRMGRAVHAAARVPGEYLEIADAGHTDLAQPDRVAYWRWLRRALEAGE